MIVEVMIARVEGGTGHGGRPARVDDTVTFDEDEFLSRLYAWEPPARWSDPAGVQPALSSLPSGRGRSHPLRLRRL